jgi:hypothetical protein
MTTHNSSCVGLVFSSITDAADVWPMGVSGSGMEIRIRRRCSNLGPDVCNKGDAFSGNRDSRKEVSLQSREQQSRLRGAGRGGVRPPTDSTWPEEINGSCSGPARQSAPSCPWSGVGAYACQEETSPPLLFVTASTHRCRRAAVAVASQRADLSMRADR